MTIKRSCRIGCKSGCKKSSCSTWLCLLAACSILTACEKPNSADTVSAPQHSQASPAQAHISIEQTDNMFNQGTQALNSAQKTVDALANSIELFLSAPTQDKLDHAQEQWLYATLDYRRFSFSRHIGLVEPSAFAQLNRLDYQISGYPIQPGFLDTYGAYKYSGLVHDISFPITEESLSNQHGLTDLRDIVLGTYAIEFLLFNVEQARNIDDFNKITRLDSAHKERGFEDAEEVPSNRRRALLRQQAKILSKNIRQLNTLWNGEPDNSVYTQWKKTDASQQINIIQNAMESALTQIMIEIGEFNRDEGENRHISPGIYRAKFDEKQKFINFALTSIQAGAELLTLSTQADIKQSISTAIELTQLEELADNTSKKDHWRKVFGAIKNASDKLTHDRQ